MEKNSPPNREKALGLLGLNVIIKILINSSPEMVIVLPWMQRPEARR